MSHTPHWTVIDRHLAGEASAADAAEIRAWLEASPENALMLETLREAGRPRAEAWSVNDGWTRLSARMADEAPVISLESRRRRPLATTWRVAAMLLVTVGAVALWRTSTRRETQIASAVPQRETIAPRGRRLPITLDDGTRVTLNGGSRLAYAIGTAGTRDVTLDGEAQFEVTHDARRPFRVHTRTGIAEDIGTRFVVRAYAEQAEMEVAVAEGVVAVRRERDDATGVTVNAGQTATLAAEGAAVVAPTRNAERYFGWTQGLLVLDGESLRTALPRIERWYDIRIDVNAALGARQVSGTFRSESAADALAAIALALDASVQWSGTTARIVPRTQ